MINDVIDINNFLLMQKNDCIDKIIYFSFINGQRIILQITKKEYKKFRTQTIKLKNIFIWKRNDNIQLLFNKKITKDNLFLKLPDQLVPTSDLDLPISFFLIIVMYEV